jgi:DNA-binding NtrC family response regulator
MSVHFLIADRDPRVREECRRYLIARGYSAAAAADELQCIEQIQQKTPSVLVLDAGLLGNGGESVLEWLTSWPSPERIVVLVTDGHTTRPLPEHLRSLVAGRMERPQTLHEMERFINQLHELIDDDRVDGMSSDPLAVARVYQ